jgi:hypothetical protein
MKEVLSEDPQIFGTTIKKVSCPEDLMPGIWAPAFEGKKTNCILYSSLFRPNAQHIC